MRWGNNNVPLCNVRYNIIYEKSRKIIFRDFLSAAELADFILNEPTRRSGELVDAANARKVAAIDGVRGGNARVFTHEDGGDADACARRARTSSAVSSTPICPS